MRALVCLCCALVACSSTPETLDGPPSCLPEVRPQTPSPDTDAPTDPWEDADQYLLECTGLLGVDPSCAAPAQGTVRLGDETWDLSWGCVGRLILDDHWSDGETSYSASHPGLQIALGPADGCSPQLTMAVVFAGDESGAEVLDIPVDDLLCPVGEAYDPGMRRLSVALGVGEDCHLPVAAAPGDLHLERSGETGLSGSLRTEVQVDGGPGLPLEVHFSVEPKELVGAMQVIAEGLCRAR